MHKRLTIQIQVTKVKNTKGCHGQTAQSQAGTSKGKLANTKAPSLT